MLNYKNFNFYFLNSKNYPVVAHAKFPVALQGTSKRLAVEVRVSDKTFFNGVTYLFSPPAGNLGNILRYYQVMVDDLKHNLPTLIVFSMPCYGE